jgi:hypothetical protein
MVAASWSRVVPEAGVSQVIRAVMVGAEYVPGSRSGGAGWMAQVSNPEECHHQ